MKMPEAAKFLDVDACIECVDFGPFNKEVQSALLAAMPNAYGDRPESETPPEPDANPQYKLARIWSKLDEKVQLIILGALIKEGRV